MFLVRPGDSERILALVVPSPLILDIVGLQAASPSLYRAASGDHKGVRQGQVANLFRKERLERRGSPQLGSRRRRLEGPPRLSFLGCLACAHLCPISAGKHGAYAPSHFGVVVSRRALRRPMHARLARRRPLACGVPRHPQWLGNLSTCLPPARRGVFLDFAAEYWAEHAKSRSEHVCLGGRQHVRRHGRIVEHRAVARCPPRWSSRCGVCEHRRRA